eukprot:c6226_g1_i1 orf=68-508(+)
MSGSILTGEKTKYTRDILGLCPWCKIARESALHLFWTCLAFKSFWNNIGTKLKQILGQVSLAAQMILLGQVRQHSEEFYFCWHLIRVVCTYSLWTARNRKNFQNPSETGFSQNVDSCIIKIGKMLKAWPGKGKLEARRIGLCWEEG